jgi:hypothetical protein
MPCVEASQQQKNRGSRSWCFAKVKTLCGGRNTLHTVNVRAAVNICAATASMLLLQMNHTEIYNA